MDENQRKEILDEQNRGLRERIKELERSLGLDQPLPIQYLKWLRGIVQGDFGRSYVSRRPVINMIAERLPATVLLSGTSMILGFLVGVPLGIYAALKRGSWFDNFIRIVTVAGNAIPHWWLALIMIIFFSIVIISLESTAFGNCGGAFIVACALVVHILQWNKGPSGRLCCVLRHVWDSG